MMETGRPEVLHWIGVDRENTPLSGDAWTNVRGPVDNGDAWTNVRGPVDNGDAWTNVRGPVDNGFVKPKRIGFVALVQQS
jgi:hypothetical protein